MKRIMREPYTIPEVMRILAVSDKTVRRMLRAGVLREQGRDPSNRILVDPESVDAAAVALGRVDIHGSEVRRELAPTLNNLSEMVIGLNQLMVQQNQQLIELARQLGEAQAEARLYPAIAEEARQRAQFLERELQRTRQELDEARQEIESLRALLAQSIDQESSQGDVASLRARLRKILNTD